MAENKKSFLLYCDLIHTVSKMPKEKAGELFMHILEYVNDKNPITEDLIIQLTFEPVKQSLKRDLQKYENIRLKNIDNANKRWNKNNATASDGIRPNTKNAVSDSVSVNDSDSDSVSVNDINKIKHTATPFSFFNSLVSLGVKKELANDWIKVRKTKKLTNTETAFNNLKNEFDKSNIPINDIIEKCIIESWGGFKNSWLNKSEPQKINGKEFSANFEHPDKRPTL